MPKVRTPTFRALVAFAAQIIPEGIWAMIDPTAVAKAAPYLVGVGVVVVLVAYLWDEGRAYIKYKRGPRHIYVASIKQNLPTYGPVAPFRVYEILPLHRENATEPEFMISWGEHSGKIRWRGTERPECYKIEVTNHSAETLVNIAVDIELRVVRDPRNLSDCDFEKLSICFDQARAGETVCAYVVNRWPTSLTGRIGGASGTPIGSAPRALKIHTRSPGLMVFFASPLPEAGPER